MVLLPSEDISNTWSMVLLPSEDIFRIVCVNLQRYHLPPSPLPPSAQHCCAGVVWGPRGRAPLFGYYLSGWNVSVFGPKMPDVGAFQTLRGLHAYLDLPAIWTLCRYFMGGGLPPFPLCHRSRRKTFIVRNGSVVFSLRTGGECWARIAWKCFDFPKCKVPIFKAAKACLLRASDTRRASERVFCPH